MSRFLWASPLFEPPQNQGSLGEGVYVEGGGWFGSEEGDGVE